ncbi:MAG TPA: nuclear transport factor 2 family protein [Candidatus Tumulicola sp.]|nr:nuclear transport factor 2 family protein [Candidatus Tumulicola sp.]
MDSATRAQLWAARDSVWRAWFAGDSASLSHLLPAAVAAGSGGGEGWETRNATMAAARQFADGGGKLTALRFDSTSIRLRGNVAVMQSRYILTLEQRGERATRTGIATEVFVRTPGGWQNPFWYLE